MCRLHVVLAAMSGGLSELIKLTAASQQFLLHAALFAHGMVAFEP